MVSSMTGFANGSGDLPDLSWTFEVKSVNGRGLDMRLYIPPGFEALEQPIRAIFKDKFARGNMQAALNVKEQAGDQSVRIDTGLVTRLARSARIMAQSRKLDTTGSAADLFAIKGALLSEKSTTTISEDSETGRAILRSVEVVADQLKDARNREGAALLSVLDRTVTDMETEVTAAKSSADVQPAQLMTRLKERAAALLEDSRISDERLEQELAILVSKADITEEIDRLVAHFADARKHLASAKPVGRKLDFLSQELLREANTMGSKSASLEMTRHSLALKSLIDQFKEQVANVE